MSEYAHVVHERRTVDRLGWSVLRAPATLSKVVLKNIGQQAVRVRTDETDSTTEHALGVGETLDFAPMRVAAYHKADRVCAIQAEVQSATVLITWVA